MQFAVIQPKPRDRVLAELKHAGISGLTRTEVSRRCEVEWSKVRSASWFAQPVTPSLSTGGSRRVTVNFDAPASPVSAAQLTPYCPSSPR